MHHCAAKTPDPACHYTLPVQRSSAGAHPGYAKHTGLLVQAVGPGGHWWLMAGQGLASIAAVVAVSGEVVAATADGPDANSAYVRCRLFSAAWERV